MHDVYGFIICHMMWAITIAVATAMLLRGEYVIGIAAGVFAAVFTFCALVG